MSTKNWSSPTLKGRKEKELNGMFQVEGGKPGLHGEIFPGKRPDQLYQMLWNTKYGKD